MEPHALIQKALEKAVQEAAEKEGLRLPSCDIRVTPADGGRYDYLIDFPGPDGRPAGPGFRNIRPVEPRDFDDPKFRVRLLHNLGLWIKAMVSPQKTAP